jgi:hypothetical protein
MAENNTTIAGWLSDDFKLSDGPRGQITGGRPRAKNYALVVYPDDLPDRAKDTWMGSLSSLGYKMAVSPLHDKDTNPDGEIKKAHWHVLLQGDKSWINFKTLKELVLTEFDGRGVAVPQSVSNVVGFMRYLVHLDNPEKFQYDKNDIRLFNGATVENAFALSKDDELAIRCDIIRYVREHEDVNEYYQVVDTALQMSNDGDNAWIKALDNRSHMIESYIRSKRHAKFDAKKTEIAYKEDELRQLMQKARGEVSKADKAKQELAEKKERLEVLVKDACDTIAKANALKAKAKDAKAEDGEDGVEKPFG